MFFLDETTIGDRARSLMEQADALRSHVNGAPAKRKSKRCAILDSIGLLGANRGVSRDEIETLFQHDFRELAPLERRLRS